MDAQISSTFDIYGDYDVSYQKGEFWVNANVDGAGNCDSAINSQWFYDEPMSAELEEEYKGRARNERGSLSVSAAIWKNLREKYPDAPKRGLVAEWAEEVCLYEQQEAGIDCPLPDELPDCSDFPADPATNDIVISLDEMIDSFNLSDCQIETRQHMYQWADIMAQKKFLCEGCYDPICGVRGIMQVGRCLFDSMEHDYSEETDSVADSVMALLVTAREGARNNTAVLVLVVAALLILAAKRWLDSLSSSKPKVMLTEMEVTRPAANGYGAVF